MTPEGVLAALDGPWWPERIGQSALGRSIRGRGFGLNGRAPVLLFGAIHGDEPLGVACLIRLADELVTVRCTPTTRPAWIVPVLNPDGYLRGRKNNARDVDLNRNFPATNWRREHSPGYDPGDEAGSEPETQALVGLIERMGITRIVALHSPFRTVNYDGPSRPLAERMAARNGYGATADIGYPTPGSLGSFYGVERGLEVITLEIPPVTEEQAWAENRLALYEALDGQPLESA